MTKQEAIKKVEKLLSKGPDGKIIISTDDFECCQKIIIKILKEGERWPKGKG